MQGKICKLLRARWPQESWFSNGPEWNTAARRRQPVLSYLSLWSPRTNRKSVEQPKRVLIWTSISRHIEILTLAEKLEEGWQVERRCCPTNSPRPDNYSSVTRTVRMMMNSGLWHWRRMRHEHRTPASWAKYMEFHIAGKHYSITGQTFRNNGKLVSR